MGRVNQNNKEESKSKRKAGLDFDLLGPLTELKNELKTGSYLRGCLSAFCEFRSSPVFDE